MKLDDLGKPAQCTRCKKTYPSDQMIFEGEDLEPICQTCLREVDGPRADLLAKIQGMRRPKGPS